MKRLMLGWLLAVLGLSFASWQVRCGGDAPAGSPSGSGGGALQSAGCTFVDQGFGPDGSVVVRAETVASGLAVPWAIAFLPGGDMLVTERPGRLRMIRAGVLQPQPVLTLGVFTEGESGLLGVAVHPQFASNRYFYLYYTVNKPAGPVNRVQRYVLAGSGATANADRIIIDDIPAAAVHDGGRIRFGPDGMLYIGTGDATQRELAQQSSSRAGKILRLTPDGAVPVDNPFAGLPTFILGIRNTQGFDWFNESTLLVVDHGPSGELGRSGGDEVNVASAGANLGWPDSWRCDTREGATAPILSWRQALPPGGAAIYTGMAIAAWRGNLIVGALGAMQLHRIVFESTGGSIRVTVHEAYLRGNPPNGLGRVREVIMGPDGHLYVSTSNCDGRGTCPADGDKVFRVRGP